MVVNGSGDTGSSRGRWNGCAEGYDEWYETLEGAVEHYVDLELLKEHLPENTDAAILDAAGGTGRLSLPLAKMGYSVTLCDISSSMLGLARRKMRQEDIVDRAAIVNCDICNLPFGDGCFDFVICWDGAAEAREELIRVTKKGGRVSLFLVNKWAAAIECFCRNPVAALSLITSSPGLAGHTEEGNLALSEEEARELFEAEGIAVVDIHAVCGWADVLSMPRQVRLSTDWDETFFKQTIKMVLQLAREPTVRGKSRHLVLYGEKR